MKTALSFALLALLATVAPVQAADSVMDLGDRLEIFADRALIHTMGGARVVLMTSNPISWTDTLRKLCSTAPYILNDPDGMNILLRDYADAVRKVAREENVELVDIYAAFKKADQRPGHKPGWLSKDGMHPAAAGHRLVAGLLIEHLTAAEPRSARRPHTVWTPSGDANEVSPHAIDITHEGRP